MENLFHAFYIRYAHFHYHRPNAHFQIHYRLVIQRSLWSVASLQTHFRTARKRPVIRQRFGHQNHVDLHGNQAICAFGVHHFGESWQPKTQNLLHSFQHHSHPSHEFFTHFFPYTNHRKPSSMLHFLPRIPL